MIVVVILTSIVTMVAEVGTSVTYVIVSETYVSRDGEKKYV